MKRELVKQTAIRLIETSGLINLSRSRLCEAAGIADGSFPYVMGCSFTDFVAELKAEGIAPSNHPVTKSRTDPKLREASILNAAVELSKELGYQNITRDGVAERAGISMGLVTRYFGTMVNLQRAVMGAALRDGIAEIIAQGLAHNDPRARKAPPELKERAIVLLSQ